MAGLKGTIAEKSEILNETDKEILEINLSQLRTLNEEYIKFAESIDKATEEIVELQNVMETGSGADFYNNEAKKAELDDMLTAYYELEEARKSGNKNKIEKIKKNQNFINIGIDVDKDKLSVIHKKIIEHFVK
jgi:hypothetical protein